MVGKFVLRMPFVMRAHYLYCLCVANFVLFGASDVSPTTAGHAVILNSPAETTETILEGLARAAVHELEPGSAGSAPNDYAIDRQRMLDAEEVAIKRIVRGTLGALLAKQAGAK